MPVFFSPIARSILPLEERMPDQTLIQGNGRSDSSIRECLIRPGNGWPQKGRQVTGLFHEAINKGPLLRLFKPLLFKSESAHRYDTLDEGEESFERRDGFMNQ